MKLITATIEKMEDYVRLQNEFTSANKSPESHVCNALAPIEDADRTHFEEIYKEKLDQKNTYFVLMEDEGIVCGFFYGYYITSPSLYNSTKIGHIGTIFISKPWRGKGYFSQTKDTFISWLKQNDVHSCHVYITTTNETVPAMYKKWGFETDEKLLIKEI